jgi:AcrR family transcriptional regulator
MKAKQADQSRSTLLQAAFCEIHRKGYQAASIADILQDTGLTKGALYHHFPTKQSLGLAVVEEVIGEYLAKLLFEPIRQSDDPVEALLYLISHIDKKVAPDFVMLGCPLNNLMQEMSALDPEFKVSLNGILKRWRDTVEWALVTGQKRGDIRSDVGAKSAALFIVSAWEGCIGIAKNLQSNSAFKSCMKQLHDYVAGLRTK